MQVLPVFSGRYAAALAEHCEKVIVVADPNAVGDLPDGQIARFQQASASSSLSALSHPVSVSPVSSLKRRLR